MNAPHEWNSKAIKYTGYFPPFVHIFIYQADLSTEQLQSFQIHVADFVIEQVTAEYWLQS